MKSGKTILLTATIAVTAIITPISSIAADSKDLTAKLVRTLGYGSAIHSFKNFVLRGDEKYMQGADKQFSASKGILAELKSADLSGAEKAAVADIEGVVDKYSTAVSTVKSLVDEKKSAKEIDQAVKISDGPAVKGIETLREGKKWSALEEIEYALGYGNAIHKFKNCVLRGNQDDKGKNNCDKAEKLFAEVEALLSGVEAVAAAKISETLTAYKANTPQVKSLATEGKSPEEIDSAVKVSDGPAKEGLAVLRN